MRPTARKIVYVTGTRADYGLMKSVLNAVRNHPKLELTLIVTGMHLMSEFGETIKEIKKDGFEYEIANFVYQEDNKPAMAEFVGNCIVGILQIVKKIQPDIIIVLGDRGEMLSGAVTGVYCGIPVAHIHGGEVSSTVDEIARHAITKLAHIHFPATQNSAKRILKMGEEAWRVHVVGAPSLDTILNAPLIKKDELGKKYHLDFKEPILLAVQHPVSMEISDCEFQIEQTLEAIKKLQLQCVWIYPNADAGGRVMVQRIRKYENLPFLQTYKSLPYEDYLSLMGIASVMIGNSSSGIIESASFRLPVVNVGTRQKNRERGENIIDVGYDKHEIVRAIEEALYDKKFRERVQHCKNPYGDGKTGHRIADILAGVRIDRKLLQKQITY